jgi:hypothetical protein
MKPFILAITSVFLLAGCAHQASYDSLGGYESSNTSYSIGVSSGYPVYDYGYGYAPMYRPYYGHRHSHDSYHHRHDRHRHDRGDRDGRGHDHGDRKSDRPGGKPRVESRAHGGGDARPHRGDGKPGAGSRRESSRGDRGR